MSPPDDHFRRPSMAPFWGALAACALMLFWIADSAEVLEHDQPGAWHHYDYLIEGFVHGHTHLSVAPDPGLLKLKDPYDPQANGPYRLWDASLYKGQYYLYFGPTPAILLLPWRLIAGHPLPQRLAVAAFAIAGVGALALFVLRVRRLHFPKLSPDAAGVVLIASVAASWLPVVLRRPDVWELPVVAGCACLWWGLYFLWRCLESDGGTGWAVGIGCMVALMLGSRPTELLAGALLIVMIFQITKSARRPVTAAATIAGVAGVLLLLYNTVRFGNPLEFGQSYQLWGADERGVRHFSLTYAAHNAWVYLLALPSLSPYFPFVMAVPPGGEPPGYLGIDEMHGGLVAVPVQLAGIAAAVWSWRQRRNPDARALRCTIAASLLCSVLSGAVLFCFAGAVTRYSTELFAGSTVAAAIGMMAVLGGKWIGTLANVSRLLVLCACAWTVGFSALASAENRIFFRKTNPLTYSVAAHVLNYPSLWYAQSQGIVYGPMALSVHLEPFTGVSSTVLLSSGRPGMTNQLVLERLDARHARFLFAENALSGVLATPVLEVEGNRLRARIEAPWLYPPTQHPWWREIRNASLRADLRTRFVLQAGGTATATHTAAFFDPTEFEPRVATRESEGGRGAWVEALESLPVPSR